MPLPLIPLILGGVALAAGAKKANKTLDGKPLEYGTKAAKFAGKTALKTAEVTGKAAIYIAAEGANQLIERGGGERDSIKFHKDIFNKGLITAVSEGIERNSEEIRSYEEALACESPTALENIYRGDKYSSRRVAAENILRERYRNEMDSTTDGYLQIMADDSSQPVRQRIAIEELKKRESWKK